MRKPLDNPMTTLGAGETDPNIVSSRILYSNRTPVAGDDTDVTGWNKSNEFIVVAQLDEAKGPWTTSYSLWYQDTTDGDGWRILNDNGELRLGQNTALTDGTSVVIGEKACSNTPAGSTWQDGYEFEGSASSTTFELPDEYYTELHFAVDPSGAEDFHKYTFAIYDNTASSTIGTLAAELTTDMLFYPEAAWGDTIDFEAPTYSTGDLDGQDSWSCDDGTYDIQNSVADEGSQAVINNGNNVLCGRNITSADSGVLYASFRSSATDDGWYIRLNEGGSYRGQFGLRSTGEFRVEGADSQNFGSYSADTWYRIGCEIDATNNRFRINVDGGSFSNWASSDGAFSNISNIEFVSQSGNASNGYWDYISDNAEVPAAGVEDPPKKKQVIIFE